MLRTTVSNRIRVLSIYALKHRTIRCYTTIHLNQEITSLEDLAKLKSLDDVDPVLVHKLINEKTSELNLKTEIQRLRTLQEERENSMNSGRPVKLGDFKRAGIMFILMSSSVYLCWQLLWWHLAYNDKEIEMLDTVNSLEKKLREEIKHNEIVSIPKTHESIKTAENTKSWYSKWW